MRKTEDKVAMSILKRRKRKEGKVLQQEGGQDNDSHTARERVEVSVSCSQ